MKLYKIIYKFHTDKWNIGNMFLEANSPEDARKKMDMHESCIISIDKFKPNDSPN